MDNNKVAIWWKDKKIVENEEGKPIENPNYHKGEEPDILAEDVVGDVVVTTMRLPFSFNIETIIFGGKFEGATFKSKTIDDSLDKHEAVVDALRRGEDPYDILPTPAQPSTDWTPYTSPGKGKGKNNYWDEIYEPNVDWDNAAYYKFSYDPEKYKLDVWPCNSWGFPDHYSRWGNEGYSEHSQGRIYPDGTYMIWEWRPYHYVIEDMKLIQEEAGEMVEQWTEDNLNKPGRFLTEDEGMQHEYDLGFQSWRDYGMRGFNPDAKENVEKDLFKEIPEVEYGDATDPDGWENLDSWMQRDTSIDEAAQKYQDAKLARIAKSNGARVH